MSEVDDIIAMPVRGQEESQPPFLPTGLQLENSLLGVLQVLHHADLLGQGSEASKRLLGGHVFIVIDADLQADGAVQPAQICQPSSWTPPGGISLSNPLLPFKLVVVVDIACLFLSFFFVRT